MDPSFLRRQQAESHQARQHPTQPEPYGHPFHFSQPPMMTQVPRGFVSTQGYLPFHQHNGHVPHEQSTFVQMGHRESCGQNDGNDPGIFIDINIYVNPRNQADLYSKIPNLKKFLTMTGSEPCPTNGVYFDLLQQHHNAPCMFNVPVHPHGHVHESNNRPSFQLNFSEAAFYSDRRPHDGMNLSGIVVNGHQQAGYNLQNRGSNPEFAEARDHHSNFGAFNSVQINRTEPSRVVVHEKTNQPVPFSDSIAIRKQKPNAQIEVMERIGIRPQTTQPPLNPTEAAFRGFINQVSREQKPVEEPKNSINHPGHDGPEEEDNSEDDDRSEEEDSNSEESSPEPSNNLKIIPPNTEKPPILPLPNRNYDFINSVPIKPTTQDALRGQQRPSFSFQHQAGSRITESIPLTKRDVTEFKNEIHVTQRNEDTLANSRNLATQIKKIKYFWRGTNFNYPYTHRRKYQKKQRTGDDRFFTEIIDFSKKVIQPNMNIDQKFI
jgi:hypothetical protein